jgi:hypothetical protein
MMPAARQPQSQAGDGITRAGTNAGYVSPVDVDYSVSLTDGNPGLAT